MDNLVMVTLNEEVPSFYLPKNVAHILTNEVDGIHCASVLMGYSVDFLCSKLRNDKSRESVHMSFHKEEDFCFGFYFYYDNHSKKVSDVLFSCNPDMLKEKDLEKKFKNIGLSLNYYNCVSVDCDEKMKKVFDLITYLL